MVGNGTGKQFRQDLATEINELKDKVAEEAFTLNERLAKAAAEKKLRELQRELGVRATDRT